MSELHREALAHLLYGVGGAAGGSGAGGGFVLLSGEIGTGKTTVCRCFLEQIPAHCNVAYIFNPKLTVVELLQSICDEFHVAVPRAEGREPTVKDYLDPLNAFLLQAHAAGRNNVLIIDEAQNLSAQVLEQLRLLTNLETADRKLLQIILIGQPELRALLARPELEQLAQRVIARYHLGPLTEQETGQYIRHRLEVAGLSRPLPFDARALRHVHRLARGIPRRINLLCDRALLGAFATGEPRVTAAIVKKAAGEVFDRPHPAVAPWRRHAPMLGAVLVAAAAALAAANHFASGRAATQAPASAPQARPAASRAAGMPVGSAAPASSAGPIAIAPVLLRDEAQAWRELASGWKASPGEGEPCRALAGQQLQCFSRSLSVPMIRQLARPGIVKLDSTSATPSYAVLTALTRDSATLRAGGSEQTVTLAALAARWRGDFATLWRTPPGYDSQAADRQGPAVREWALARLPMVQPAGATTDAAFKERLRAFQVAHGLPADGLLGPMTLMQLNRAAGVDEPRLRTEP
jgi:general secretion pathway protein A